MKKEQRVDTAVTNNTRQITHDTSRGISAAVWYLNAPPTPKNYTLTRTCDTSAVLPSKCLPTTLRFAIARRREPFPRATVT